MYFEFEVNKNTKIGPIYMNMYLFWKQNILNIHVRYSKFTKNYYSLKFLFAISRKIF